MKVLVSFQENQIMMCFFTLLFKGCKLMHYVMLEPFFLSLRLLTFSLSEGWNLSHSSFTVRKKKLQRTSHFSKNTTLQRGVLAILMLMSKSARLALLMLYSYSRIGKHQIGVETMKGKGSKLK